MDSEKTIIAAFSDFIAATTEQRAYPADEDVILPDGDFISLKLLSTEPTSWETTYKNIPDDTCIEEYWIQMLGEVRITGFGKQSYNWLNHISRAFRNTSLKNILKKRGLAYTYHSEIRNDSVPIDNTKTEKRFTMLVHFYFIVGEESITGAADVIETVQPPLFIGEYIN